MYQEATTVAILSGTPIVTRALDILLRGVGYEVRLLGEPEVFGVQSLLDGTDVLLLGSGLDDEYREGFLNAMASTPKTAVIPVLSFFPSLPGALAREERSVQWPCKTADLAQQIEAALRPAAEQEI